MEIKGIIKEIFPVRTGKSTYGDKDWVKQEFLLIYKDGKYDREILMQLMGDKKEQLDVLADGMEVMALFNIESHKHNERYFTLCTCWKIWPI